MKILNNILLVLVYLIIVPGPFLTIWNLTTLIFEKKYRTDFEWKSFSLGIFCMMLLYALWSPRPWNESIVSSTGFSQMHEPLSSEHVLTIVVLFAIGLFSYGFLKNRKEKPPLAKVLAMTGVYTGIMVNILIVIQLSGICADNSRFMNFFPFDVLLMMLVPLNYIVLAVVQLVDTVREHSRRLQKEQAETLDKNHLDNTGKKEPYKSRILNNCNRVLAESSRWGWYALLLTLPFLFVVTVILLLFGQKPDSAIRAFTETSDWTLSTKISPPEVMANTHYLCTVALRGHEKLVRPTRMGLRWGEKIVVNRQLCVANAFEQLLEERTPRFHRGVRKFYDTYGYPISRHIWTPLTADITYLIMKPLELVFIAVLYLFDEKPEDRIARQYLPKF